MLPTGLLHVIHDFFHSGITLIHLVQNLQQLFQDLFNLLFTIHCAFSLLKQCSRSVFGCQPAMFEQEESVGFWVYNVPPGITSDGFEAFIAA